MAISANHLTLKLHQQNGNPWEKKGKGKANPPTPILLSSRPLLRSISHQRPPPLSVSVRAVLGGAKQLIASQTVKSVHPKDASNAIDSLGFQLLDVRPEWERIKARVPGSLHVPLFVKDQDNGPLTLLKKWVHFGYIGLWTGQQFTTINADFVDQVQTLIPDKNNAKLLVACGEGLRSMVAASKLHEAGYQNLGWLVGGFARVRDGDLPVEGTEKLQYATVGGASYYFLKLLQVLQAVD